MPKMTIEEAIKMRGTEFTYVFEDGDTIPAFVKEFDPEVGLSCHSLAGISAEGFDFSGVEKEEDGSVCLIGMRFKFERKSQIEKALAKLEEIRDTGKYVVEEQVALFTPSCAFS